jgi:hypothetical protein
MTLKSIDVASDVAELYQSVPKATQEKIQVLLRFWLRDMTDPSKTLSQVMDEMSDYAELQGLTPDILEALLKDDEP